MDKSKMMFTIYNQLGTHMWTVKRPLDRNGRYVSDRVEDYEESWRRRYEYARKCGANTVSVDIGEMLQYPSHPEIWIKGAWSAEKMNGWVKWLKSLGYRDVIPSLNFSTDHDVWLGEYSRMISTPKYYEVCRDLIRDAWEVFDHPRIINFGMDEEDYHVMGRSRSFKNAIIIIRQSDLYWHDNLFFIREIEKLGAQAWMWSDKIWFEKEDYLKHIPKSVLQGNWCYTPTFDLNNQPLPWYKERIEAYSWLEEAGYDQIPGCSNYLNNALRKKGMQLKDNHNIEETFRYCKKVIAPERLKGFHVMSWEGITPKDDGNFFLVCDMMRKAIDEF